MDEFAVYSGIDWVDKKHDLCVLDSAAGGWECATLPHKPWRWSELSGREPSLR